MVVNESISVIFPCYNEEGNLSSLYESTTAVLQGLKCDYQIIFIDDGSSDGSPALLSTIGKMDSRVLVVRHPMNLGYGAAVRTGIATATKELIFHTDSDLQFDINELPALLPLMCSYDILTCFRLNRRDGITRKINAWCWTKLICALFGIHIKDINCAFKLYNRRVFNCVKMRSTGALINAEILIAANRHGFKIGQIGVRHFPRKFGKQTGAHPKVILHAFRELMIFRKEING